MARNPALLFHPNPHEEEAELRGLFHNRKTEMEHGLDILTSDAIPPLPLAVHGPTRGGKSHFARYLIFEAVAQGAKFTPLIVQASDKSTARRVLAKMYLRLLEDVPEFPGELKDAAALEAWSRELQEFHDVRRLIEDPNEKLEVERTEADARLKSSRLGFSVAPSIAWKPPGPTGGPEPRVDARADYTRANDLSQSESRKVKVVLALPTDDHVVAWIQRLLEFRRRVERDRRVLFLVDDLDLLDPRRENGDACGVLLDKLGELASKGTCVVVVTVRSQAYNERDKESKPLAEITTWTDPGDLLEVLRKRTERFNEGEAVFDEDALTWLSQRVEGRIGMLLQHCQEISQKVPKSQRPLTRVIVLKRLRDQFAEWRREAELVYILDKVETEVRAGRQQVEFDEELPPNALLYRLLTRVTGKKYVYAVAPLYLQALLTTEA